MGFENTAGLVIGNIRTALVIAACTYHYLAQFLPMF